MTAIDESVDTDIDWDLIMNEDVPCAYENCTDAAKWKATFIPCGHQHNLCNTHRGFILARWADPRARRCVVSDITITDLKWTEL